jgi:hypothetical protein
MTTPWEYVKAKLVENGSMDVAGNTRRAKARGCTRCHAPVIAGYDADLCARLVVVDPYPLTALGEAVAQLQGRYTCALHRGGRPELDTRTDWRIAHTPAGSKRFDVLASHVCNDDSLLAFTCPSVFTRAAIDLAQPCPF